MYLQQYGKANSNGVLVITYRISDGGNKIPVAAVVYLAGLQS